MTGLQSEVKVASLEELITNSPTLFIYCVWELRILGVCEVFSLLLCIMFVH